MAKLRSLAGYGVGDFGLNIYWNTLSLYLVYWYTTILKIPPEVAGTIFLVGMFWDAISDPIVAAMSERVNTRHGTYRPFLLFGSFVLAAGFALLFWAPPFEGGLLIATLIVVGIIFRTAYTLVAIPYSVMSARLTFNSVERTEFSGVRMFFAFAGLLVVSNLLLPMVRQFSDEGGYSAAGFQMTAIIGGVVATGALLMCFMLTKELKVPPKKEPFRIDFVKLFQTLKSNRALLILLFVIFLQSGASAATMISMVFFIETNQEIMASKEVVQTAFAIATICGVPIWTVFSRQFGRKRAWIIASSMVAAFGAHMLIFGPFIINGLPIQVLGFGLCASAIAVLLWSFIPDAVEYGHMAHGRRTESVVFGAVLVAQKISGGVMGFIVGQVLAGIGYDPNLETQSATAGQGLTVFLSVLPALFLTLSIIPILLLPLDRRTHADIVDKLASDPHGAQKEI